jgi:hypothetical protein
MSIAQAIDFTTGPSPSGFSQEYFAIRQNWEDKQNEQKEIPVIYSNPRRQFQVIQSLKALLLEHLENLQNDLELIEREPNHPIVEEDFYISEGALEDISRFTEMLPPDIPAPDVSLDPDGDISLEWYKNPTCVFSISFRGGGLLFYAGLFGLELTDHVYGRELVGDSINSEIIRNIRKVLA